MKIEKHTVRPAPQKEALYPKMQEADTAAKRKQLLIAKGPERMGRACASPKARKPER
jgi:hypothetical protein